MSESTTTNEITMAAPIGLKVLGDADAAACVGDFCEIPEHHSTVVMNRRLDDDAV